jgi:acetyl-CoA C-acetyltransferase
VPNTQLATTAVKAAIQRAGIAPDAVGHVVMGNVIPTDTKDAYLSRVAAIDAGCPIETPAFNVNRLCGSGLQAIISAAQAIGYGDCDVAVGGGSESMSRGPYFDQGARWGAHGRQQEHRLHARHPARPLAKDAHGHHRRERGRALQDQPRDAGPARPGQPAARRRRHRRGYFKEQIVPVEIATRKGTVLFQEDEHVRAATTLEVLAGMKPAFKKEGGTVTAGNASGINDGAAAVVLAAGDRVAALGLKPLARLVGYAHAGVDPAYMGIGPVPATQKVLARTGLKVQDMDVIEANEAFAAQACAVVQELGLRPGQGQPQRLGHFAGPPRGCHRRHHHHQGDCRAAPHGRALCAGDHVHWRRPRHCGHLRTGLSRLRRFSLGLGKGDASAYPARWPLA